MKKLLLLMAVLLCAASIAFGTGTQPAGEEEIPTISVEIFDRGNVPSEMGTLTDNRWVNWLRDEMLDRGVNLEFFPIPRSEEQTKINVLLAAGDAPDLFHTYGNEAYHRWADEGGLADLTEYAENSAAVQALWADKPHLYATVLHRGRIYAILDGTKIKHVPINHVRQDVLDQLGLDVPTTLAELENVLRTFKEEDPNNEGSENLVPLLMAPYGARWEGVGPGGSIWHPSVMSAFGFTDQAQQVVDGKLVWREEMPGFLDYMKWLNRMYNEGMIDPEFITDTNNARLNEQHLSNLGIIMQGRVDNLVSGSNKPNTFVQQVIPNVEWVMIPRLPNAQGVSNWGANGKYWFYNMVPKTSEDKLDAIFKYIDFQIEEAGEFVFDGVEGEHYRMQDGIKVVIDSAYNQATKDFFRYDTSLFKPEDPVEALRILDPNPVYGQNAYDARVLAERNAVVSMIRFDRGIAGSTDYGAELESVRLEYLNQMIVAANANAVEALYEKFLTEYERAGSQIVIDEMNEVFADMVAGGYPIPQPMVRTVY
jgi:putative aldouronate transport system substrate-binding protein